MQNSFLTFTGPPVAMQLIADVALAPEPTNSVDALVLAAVVARALVVFCCHGNENA